MQHQQQEVTNGTAQLNGNAAQSHKNASPATNGVSEASKPALQLDQHNREMVRLIGQHLTNLGFKSSVETLMKESGCRLDHPEAHRFRSCVLEGNWHCANQALQHMESMLESPKHATEMRFLLLEQKYMELIEQGEDLEALNCLRGEISPLEHDVARVHRLSSLIFYDDPNDLKRVTNWLGSGPESRAALMEKLSQYLPPSVMLPPRRLEKLVIQALQYQVDQCQYHNTTLGPLVDKDIDTIRLSEAISAKGCLVNDHKCSKDQFPVTCLHTLTDHTDEVLIVAFSPNGEMLATGSKDCSLIIWDVDKETLSLTRRHMLEGHGYGVMYCTWSPDSKMIIMCLEEDAAELLVFEVENGQQVCKVSDTTSDALTCAAWYKNNERFVCGGLRGQFFLCNLEGSILERWEGVRVQSVAVVDGDAKTVLASDTHRRIRGYNLEEVHDHSVLQEDHGIMSFGLDNTGRFALLNVATQGVHLWDLKDRNLVRKYRGATQGHCTIHSCFGGLNQDFIASGSEDHKVYIWHRSREQPVAVLSGHQRTVNSVSWNPTLPSMLCSVSDDCTIRIWGPASALKPEPSLDEEEATGSSDAPPRPVAANGQMPHLASLDINDQ